MWGAMMRRILVAALATFPACAWAQTLTPPSISQAVPGGSNVTPNFYPAPSCERPDKKRLGGAPGVQDQDAMRAYNFKIKSFNDKAVAFNACIKAYVDNAQNDINRIQAIVHAAVAEANTQQ
jgi:hypothetical protein